MRVTRKGQVTIPREIRDRLGLLPGTVVVFETAGDSVGIRKAEQQGRGKALIERMRSVARGAPRPKLSTDEILALTRSN